MVFGGALRGVTGAERAAQIRTEVATDDPARRAMVASDASGCDAEVVARLTGIDRPAMVGPARHRVVAPGVDAHGVRSVEPALRSPSCVSVGSLTP